MTSATERLRALLDERALARLVAMAREMGLMA